MIFVDGIKEIIMSEFKKIHAFIKRQPTLDLIIWVNIILFLLAQMLSAFKLFSLRYIALQAFTPNIYNFWHLLTYGFFHQGLLALLFNMILLYYFGRIFADFESGKKLFLTYLAGIILGGLFFIVSYHWFSSFYIQKNPLLGASAGVMAVITYISLYVPEYTIKIRFLGHFKLLHLLIFLILFNLLQIPLGNPGGYFAHLGGLTAGFLIFLWDKLRRPSLSNKKRNHSANIDRLLDKINHSGYESLSDDEKEELFKKSQSKN